MNNKKIPVAPELFINKDSPIEGLLLTLLDNGYQVLFDNDTYSGDHYWIKLANIELDEFEFVELFDDEYISKWDEDSEEKNTWTEEGGIYWDYEKGEE